KLNAEWTWLQAGRGMQGRASLLLASQANGATRIQEPRCPYQAAVATPEHRSVGNHYVASIQGHPGQGDPGYYCSAEKQGYPNDQVSRSADFRGGRVVGVGGGHVLFGLLLGKPEFLHEEPLDDDTRLAQGDEVGDHGSDSGTLQIRRCASQVGDVVPTAGTHIARRYHHHAAV